LLIQNSGIQYVLFSGAEKARAANLKSRRAFQEWNTDGLQKLTSSVKGVSQNNL
jgi:hypothetical protein